VLVAHLQEVGKREPQAGPIRLSVLPVLKQRQAHLGNAESSARLRDLFVSELPALAYEWQTEQAKKLQRALEAPFV
jgi:hypothetical protein